MKLGYAFEIAITVKDVGRPLRFKKPGCRPFIKTPTITYIEEGTPERSRKLKQEGTEFVQELSRLRRAMPSLKRRRATHISIRLLRVLEAYPEK